MHSGQLESPNFQDDQQKNTEQKEGRGLGLVSLADAEREQKSTPLPSGSDLGHHDSSPSKLSSSLLLSYQSVGIYLLYYKAYTETIFATSR